MSAETVATRWAWVTGALRLRRLGVRFNGCIELERRSEWVQYAMRLEAEDGKFLLFLGRGVSRRVIPGGQDEFEFALSHAVECIRRYRYGRRARPFDVESCRWGGPPKGGLGPFIGVFPLVEATR